MKKYLRLLPVLLLSALLLSGCGSTEPLPDGMEEDPLLDAGQAVVDLLIDGDYQAVYSQFREDIRAGLTVEDVEALVAPSLAEAGTFESVEELSLIHIYCQSGQVHPCLCRQLGIGVDRFCHQAGGNIVHIGHAVLKAAQDEIAHGQEGPHQAAGCVPARHGDDHAQADQQITEDSQHHPVLEGDGAFGSMGISKDDGSVATLDLYWPN